MSVAPQSPSQTLTVSLASAMLPRRYAEFYGFPCTVLNKIVTASDRGAHLPMLRRIFFNGSARQNSEQTERSLLLRISAPSLGKCLRDRWKFCRRASLNRSGSWI
jgi:hypothetical protein